MMDHILFACAHLRTCFCTRRSVVPCRAPHMRTCERVGALGSLVVLSGWRAPVFTGPRRGSVRMVMLPGIGCTAPSADVVRPMGVGVFVPVRVCTRGRASALCHCAVVRSSA